MKWATQPPHLLRKWKSPECRRILRGHEAGGRQHRGNPGYASHARQQRPREGHGMSDDYVRVAGHRGQVLVAIAKGWHQDVAEDEFRTLVPVKYLAHQLLIHARQLWPDGAESNSLRLDLLPVNRAGGNYRQVAAALQLLRQAQVG